MQGVEPPARRPSDRHRDRSDEACHDGSTADASRGLGSGPPRHGSSPRTTPETESAPARRRPMRRSHARARTPSRRRPAPATTSRDHDVARSPAPRRDRRRRWSRRRPVRAAWAAWRGCEAVRPARVGCRRAASTPSEAPSSGVWFGFVTSVLGGRLGSPEVADATLGSVRCASSRASSRSNPSTQIPSGRSPRCSTPGLATYTPRPNGPPRHQPNPLPEVPPRSSRTTARGELALHPDRLDRPGPRAPCGHQVRHRLRILGHRPPRGLAGPTPIEFGPRVADASARGTLHRGGPAA
jgi:hypothetical protein